MAIKLAILVLKLIPIAIWGWRRLTLGPTANFSGLAGIQTQQVENTEGSAEIRESCSKFGWPIEAWVHFKLQRSRLFEIAPQGGFGFLTDLEIGVPSFDEKFFTGTESQNFIRMLAARSDLRLHFSQLASRLDRHQAKLARVGAEGRDLAVQCNVRWPQNRPALYQVLLVWIQALDALLAVEINSKNAAQLDKHGASVQPGTRH